MDFEHPLEEVWPGYIRDCGEEDCEGCLDCAPYDPPEGPGWQVWENVSDGSPISPVFADRADATRWLVANENCSPAAAEAFLDQGYAPSMIATSFGFYTGVQMAAGLPAHIEWLHRRNGDDTTILPGTRVRHRESGITGTVAHRFPPPAGHYYAVTWDRGLPEVLAKEPDADPDKPMDTGSPTSGFDIISGPDA